MIEANNMTKLEEKDCEILADKRKNGTLTEKDFERWKELVNILLREHLAEELRVSKSLKVSKKRFKTK